MKSSAKRAMSFALVLILLFGSGVPAFAVNAGASKNKDLISVACIGDSIANGHSLYNSSSYSLSFGLPNKLPYTGNYEYVEARDLYQYIEGYSDELGSNDPQNLLITQEFEKDQLNAYGPQLAMQLNLTESEISEIDTFDEFFDAVDYRSLAGNADRSIDVRVLFDEEYSAEREAEGDQYLDLCENVKANRRAMKQHLVDYIAGNKSMEPVDVLLYAIGYNDFFYAPQVIAQTVPADQASATLTSEILKGLETYTENLPVILDYLQSLNSDMEIILIGVFSPYFNNELSEFSATDINQLYTYAASVINALLRKEADLRDNVTFVDVNGAAVYDYDEYGRVTSGDGIHPSASGHAYIARRIMSALPSEILESRRYDIGIDLHKVYDPADCEISSVLVNNIPTGDYTVDGCTLTVHYRGVLATNVKVVVKNGSRTSVTTWQTVYNLSDGYRTYPLYNISNLSAYFSELTQKPMNTVKSIFSRLTSIFR